jgi:hypothetical protein
MYEKYFKNFIFGGTIVSIVNILASKFNPTIGALFWSFPSSLIPVIYTMKTTGDSYDYISEFIYRSSQSILLTYIFLYILSTFIKNDKNITNALIKSILIWIFCCIVFYFVVHDK